MTIAVDGLDHGEQNTLDQLFKVWEQKLQRNKLRSQYYHQRNLFKNLGIAVPRELEQLEWVLGWPAKAVDLLAMRCRPDKFVIPGVEVDNWGIREIWRDNDMDVELPQGIKSSLIHAPTFLATSKGDIASGEPEVLITSSSAMWSAGLWNPRRRAVSAALAITDTDDGGRPIEFTLWLPDQTIYCARGAKAWTLDRRPHTLGRVPVEILPYKPSLDRPFGTSRISRAVMSIADSALRTSVRTEVAAEFFSAPQRWIMGADETMFQDADGNPKGQWSALIGRIWAAPLIVDENGDQTDQLPQVGEFRASPQTPNVEHMRSLATMFAGETGIPINSLGVIQDNPSSADAMLAGERDLILEAKVNVHDPMAPRIERTMLTAIQIRDDLDEIPTELKGLSYKWLNPETMTESAAADAVSKLVAAIPGLSESKVILERLGWDDTTVERAWADIQKAKARQTANTVLQALRAPQPPQVEQGGEAAVVEQPQQTEPDTE